MKIAVLLVIAVLSMAFATPAKVTLSGENMPKIKNEEKFFWPRPQCFWCMETVDFFVKIGWAFPDVPLCEVSVLVLPLEKAKCDIIEQKLPEIKEQFDNNVSPKEICSAPDVGICSA